MMLLPLIASSLICVGGEKLSVNDSDAHGVGEPSFVSVGFCIGTDAMQRQIIIANRLCLNHEAAEVIAAEAYADKQQLKAQAESIEDQDDELRAVTVDRNRLEKVSIGLAILAFASYFIGFILGRLAR